MRAFKDLSKVDSYRLRWSLNELEAMLEGIDDIYSGIIEVGPEDENETAYRCSNTLLQNAREHMVLLRNLLMEAEPETDFDEPDLDDEDIADEFPRT